MCKTLNQKILFCNYLMCIEQGEWVVGGGGGGGGGKDYMYIGE